MLNNAGVPHQVLDQSLKAVVSTIELINTDKKGQKKEGYIAINERDEITGEK